MVISALLLNKSILLPIINKIHTGDKAILQGKLIKDIVCPGNLRTVQHLENWQIDL